MPVPAGYTYKDGAYWRDSDGAGPFGFNTGSSVPEYRPAVGADPSFANLQYKDGRWWTADGEGPISVGA